MVWIENVRCEKLWPDFVARTLTLIAPVWSVMHQVSCSSKTVPNEPKRKETHQNMRLGPNGMDRERSLFILTRCHGTNFCINCTSRRVLRQVLCRSKNGSKCTQAERNAPKRKFRVQWCGSGVSLRKIPTWLRGTNFCINCTSLTCFAASFVS